MVIALVQLDPRLADLSSNFAKIYQAVEKAVAAGAKLVVLPELATVGYLPRDLMESPELVFGNRERLGRLAQKFPEVTIVCGFVEPNPSQVGKPLYNSLAVLQHGGIAAVYRKRLLPYYDVFEDERYFEPGQDGHILKVEGLRFGLLICEDAWNFDRFLNRLYPVQPLDDYRGGKVDFLINISGSPFHVGKDALRREVMLNAARYCDAGILFCDQVGANDDLLFDGGSFVADRSGHAMAISRRFEEDLLVVDLHTSNRVEWPTLSKEDEIARALTMGLRGYVAKSRQSKVCLGLSGGIDSSVAALLAVDALGASAVTGIALPTRFSSEATNRDAEEIARKLGIEFRVIPIEPGFEWAAKALREAYGNDLKGLTLENVQPRLRMMVLMAVANEAGALLLNTSNKSEIATGYSTLYGDSAGALAVLGDLTKEEVYTLGRTLDAGRGIIPERVFERPPSAELREGQKDEDSLPPYSFVDRVVKHQLERGEKFPELGEDADSDRWKKFRSLYAVSEFKRQQFPPILRVSPRAFGRGRRIPLASAKTWEPSYKG